MSWFSKRESPGRDIGSGESEPFELMPEVGVKPSVDYYNDVVLPMVLLEEDKVRAGQDALLAEAMKYHQTDCETFQFSCVRHGDFLTLFFHREPRKPMYSGGNLPKPKFSITVNLGLVPNISKIDGHGPDLEGTTSYRLKSFLEGRDGSHYGTEADPHEPPPSGYYRKVEPRSDFYLFQISFIGSLPEDNGKYSHGIYYPERPHYRPIKHKTLNTPRAARDDVIVFSGIDMIIHAPYSKGDEVHDKIMEAIALGYEPQSSILTTQDTQP